MSFMKGGNGNGGGGGGDKNQHFVTFLLGHDYMSMEQAVSGKNDRRRIDLKGPYTMTFDFAGQLGGCRGTDNFEALGLHNGQVTLDGQLEIVMSNKSSGSHVVNFTHTTVGGVEFFITVGTGNGTNTVNDESSEETLVTRVTRTAGFIRINENDGGLIVDSNLCDGIVDYAFTVSEQSVF